MDIEEHYTRWLMAMQQAKRDPRTLKWGDIGMLTQSVLALLDDAGLGGHAAARGLSAAMDAIELELHNSGEEFLPMAPEPDLG